jgi:glycosyltransferase involved in cell wall biosynthesis
VLDQTTVLYLNSLFSQPFSILPILMRKFGLLRIKSVVLAPRGECSPGALGLKALKKLCYLNGARWLGLYRDVLWHASSDFEANDIQRQFQKISKVETIVASTGPKGDGEPSIEGEIEIANIIIASDIPIALRDRGKSRHVKTPGRLSVVFISRISPMKNLQAALQAFNGVQGDVTFDIYGPIEDSRYWEECQRILATLPMNVRVRYRGTARHESIAGTLLRYELFLLPSLGENFGHAICEALTVGLPVLISDRTTWRNLETACVGWDISLDEPKRFREVLQQCIDGDEAWYSAISACASRYALDYCSAPEFINANRKLFDHSLARRRRYVTH